MFITKLPKEIKKKYFFDLVFLINSCYLVELNKLITYNLNKKLINLFES